MPPDEKPGRSCSACQERRTRGGRSGAPVRKPAEGAERDAEGAAVASGAAIPGACMAGAATMPQAADAVQLPMDDFDAGSATAILPQSGETARALARDPEAAVLSCWLAEPSDSCETDIGIPAHNCMMSFATPCNGSAIKSKQKSAVRIPSTMFSLYGPAHAPSKLRSSCSPLDFLTDEKVKGRDPPAQGQGGQSVSDQADSYRPRDRLLAGAARMKGASLTLHLDFPRSEQAATASSSFQRRSGNLGDGRGAYARVDETQFENDTKKESGWTWSWRP